MELVFGSRGRSRYLHLCIFRSCAFCAKNTVFCHSKIFFRMKRFVSSLTRTTNEFSRESEELRDTGNNLKSKYGHLQTNIRKSLQVSFKPKPVPSCNSFHQQTRKNTANKDTFKETSDDQNNINYIGVSYFRATPTTAARLIYDSPAKQEMYHDIMEGYCEYLQYPSPTDTYLYEGQVDPVLHIGKFEQMEINNNIRVNKPV